MKRKLTAGVTLLELIIAVAVLAVAALPIYTLYTAGLKINASAYKVTMATFAAQQRMEELVGLSSAALLGLNGDTQQDGYGFTLRVNTQNGPYDALIEAEVIVYDMDKISQLYAITHYIHIGEPAVP